MNISQIHLALTHVPVVLSLTGLVMLATGILLKKSSLSTIALYILVISGLFTIPVFFSGEGAEEIAENIPGISEAAIHKHEDIAGITMTAVMVTALASLVSLLVSSGKWRMMAMSVTFILSIASASLLAYTAHQGGAIRHPEINSSFVAGKTTESGETKKENNRKKNKEEDDD